MGELTKKDIHPIVETYSFESIIEIFGKEQGAKVAKMFGVKKTSKKSKESQDKSSED